MASGERKVVCVTGASGYIATWLTKLLLQRGYTVRATVRNINDRKKIEHLLALDGAKERLHLFEADLLIEGSFDPAIDGCQGVFHTASPCLGDCKDPQAELIDPAVKGALNVLASCAKASTVKRVVLTSSVGSMLYHRRPQTLGTVADETWESDREFCIEKKQWYVLSKILAEEAAWKFAKEKGIEMVTTNPGLVIGPMLQQTLNFSSAIIASLINNETGGGYGDARMVWIHVRDVARAHILLFENPSASGRYALVESTAYFSEILSIIHELYPNIRLPNKSGEGIFPDLPPTSKEKMKAMGMDSYIPLKMGIKETIESLKEKRIIII